MSQSSWRDVAEFVAADAPQLSDALNALELDTQLDALALAGIPGQTIWGTADSRPALYCTVTDKDIEVLVSAIQIQSIVPSLLVFEISNQQIGDGAAKAISELLSELGCVLETLDLTCCEFTGAGISVICNALATNTTVRNLRLGWNNLGREGGLAVVEMLQKNTCLESLELCNTSLDTAAIIHLYSVLRDQPKLLNVDLQKALLYSRQEDTTKHAAQMLCCNKVMHTLNISHSRVGDLGADILAKSLFRNKSLRVLCLASNQIGAEGGSSLATLLKSPDCSLFSLDISNNRLGDEGGEAIGNALAVNTSLKRLDLGTNRMEEAGLSAVAKGMFINSTLRVLLLWGNHFPTEGAHPESGGCIASFDSLLAGRFAHLDVDVDIKCYEVDGLIQVARNL